MNEKLKKKNLILMCAFSKKVLFFLNVLFVRIFFQMNIFSKKMYGLYVFALKMYGVMYGFFQKCFGHPVYTEVSDLDSSLRLSGTNPKRIFKSCGSKIL